MSQQNSTLWPVHEFTNEYCCLIILKYIHDLICERWMPHDLQIDVDVDDVDGMVGLIDERDSNRRIMLLNNEI